MGVADTLRPVEDRNRLVEENLSLASWGVNVYARSSVAGDSTLFDDLRQEACLGLLRAAEKWDPEMGSFASYARDWICQKVWRGVMRSRLISLPYGLTREERKAARDRTITTPLPDESAHPCHVEHAGELLEHDDFRDWIVSVAKRELSSSQRQAFLLCDVEGLSCSEAAARIGDITAKGVHSALSKARKAMRVHIRGES